MKEMTHHTGESLRELAAGIAPEELPGFLHIHAEELLSGPRPFSGYMRQKFREKGILQQEVFLAADISENYGYKLIAEEKHTVKRDVIMRLCLAGRFSLEETQEALSLYGMAPLRARLARDLVFAVAISNRLYDIHQVNELLLRCGQQMMSLRPD